MLPKSATRIEVDDKPVGPVDPIEGRMPRVMLNRPKVDQMEKRGKAGIDGIVNLSPLLILHSSGP